MPLKNLYCPDDGCALTDEGDCLVCGENWDILEMERKGIIA